MLSTGTECSIKAKTLDYRKHLPFSATLYSTSFSLTTYFQKDFLKYNPYLFGLVSAQLNGHLILDWTVKLGHLVVTPHEA